MADKNTQNGFNDGASYERLYDSSVSLIKTVERSLEKCSSIFDLNHIKGLIAVVEGSSSTMARLYSFYFDSEISSEVQTLNNELLSINHRVFSLENSLKSP